MTRVLDQKEEEEDEREFEFVLSWEGEEMCAADDVFHHGQILPIHSSYSGAEYSSSKSSEFLLMHHFCTHPTPKPQLGRCSLPAKASRHAGWKGLLRLGLVRLPVVDFPELRHRSLAKMFKSGGDGDQEYWWLAWLSCKSSEVVEVVQPKVRKRST